MEQQFTQAVFLSIIVMALTDYLKRPLTSTPSIAHWLVRVGIAYAKDPDKPFLGDNITIWFIPWLTFAFGAALSFTFKIDLVTPILGDVTPLGALILTAAIIGGGSNVINQITNIGK